MKQTTKERWTRSAWVLSGPFNIQADYLILPDWIPDLDLRFLGGGIGQTFCAAFETFWNCNVCKVQPPNCHWICNLELVVHRYNIQSCISPWKPILWTTGKTLKNGLHQILDLHITEIYTSWCNYSLTKDAICLAVETNRHFLLIFLSWLPFFPDCCTSFDTSDGH